MMILMTEELSLPKGTKQELNVHKKDKGMYTIYITDPNKLTHEVAIAEMGADTKDEAYYAFFRATKREKDWNKLVTDYMEQIKEARELKERQELEEMVEKGKKSISRIANISAKVLRQYLNEKGYKTVGFNREALENLVSQVIRENEPKIIDSKYHTEEKGGLVVKKKTYHYDNNTIREEILEASLDDIWQVSLNHDKSIRRITTKAKVDGNEWEVEVLGIKNFPELLDFRDSILEEVTDIIRELRKKGKDVCSLQYNGGTASTLVIQNSMSEVAGKWSVKAHLVDDGG